MWYRTEKAINHSSVPSHREFKFHCASPDESVWSVSAHGRECGRHDPLREHQHASALLKEGPGQHHEGPCGQS